MLETLLETYVTISDSAFFIGTVALINSLRLTGNTGRILVMDRGLTQRQRRLLEPHASVAATAENLSETDAWLLKAASAHLVTKGVVLLIDSDMIVTARLSKAVDAARAGKVFAYPDHRSSVERRFPEWEQLFQLDCAVRQNQTYVNAGLVAFSADTWPRLLVRLDELCRRVPADAVHRGDRHQPFWAGDQDALNALLMSEIPDVAVAVGDPQEQVYHDEMRAVTVEDPTSLRCTYRGTPVSTLHYAMTPKPWDATAWRRLGLDDAYAFLLPRVLFAADAPIRLDRRDVAPWLRGNFSARGLLASISVLRVMWSAVHR